MQKKYGVSKSYNEGHRAYEVGLQLSHCPYKPDTADGHNWCEGWRDAAENGRAKSVRADTIQPRL